MHSLLGNIRSLVTRVAPVGRSEETVHPLDEPLRLLGLERRALRGDVYVRAGRTIELAAVAAPIELTASDFAQYPQWIGPAAAELAHASLRANVFALRSLHVAAGAQLVVSGQPAILVVDRVTIEELGQLVLTTACRAWINRLEKKPAPAH
jgi:hypothetical protein